MKRKMMRKYKMKLLLKTRGLWTKILEGTLDDPKIVTFSNNNFRLSQIKSQDFPESKQEEAIEEREEYEELIKDNIDYYILVENKPNVDNLPTFINLGQTNINVRCNDWLSGRVVLRYIAPQHYKTPPNNKNKTNNFISVISISQHILKNRFATAPSKELKR